MRVVHLRRSTSHAISGRGISQLGLRTAESLGFRVEGLGLKVQNSGIGLGCVGLGLWGLGFEAWGSGFGV